MKEYIIYLAGPMGGVARDQIMGWRDYVTSKLPKNVSALNPARNCPDEAFPGGIHKEPDESSIGIFENQKSVPRLNRHDLKRSDLVFFNFLGSTHVSIGSCVEMGLAEAWHKIKVVVLDDKNIHNHPLIKEFADYIVPDLDAGIEVVKSVFGEANWNVKHFQAQSAKSHHEKLSEV